MASTLFFNGQLYTTPTTVSDVLDGAEAPINQNIGNTVCFIGNSAGGQPNTYLTFGSPDEAAAVLVSGDVLTAVTKAFNPSNEIDGPGEVGCIIVGNATQSTLALTDNTGAVCINLTTTQYGVPSTLFQVSVQPDANSDGNLTLTITDGENYASGTNVGRTAFTVSASGSGVTSATITITETTCVLAANSTTVATFLLSTYTTVDQLVAAINTVTHFTAAVVAGSSGTPALEGLDHFAAANCFSSPFSVTANLQACVDWFNSSAAGGFVTAVRATATCQRRPATLPLTPMTGGAGTYDTTLADWVTALEVLQGVDLQWLVSLYGENPSSPIGITAACDAHCQYMSTVGGKERRHLTGPALGATIAQAEALAFSINSDRTSIVYPGYQDYNAAGDLVMLPSWQSAVLVGAGFAAMTPGSAMTNKTITARGLEQILRVPTDTDILIQAGVMPLIVTQEGYKVARSVSCWLDNDNYNRVEVSCGAATDYMMRSVRDALQVLIGGPVSPQALGRAEAITQSVLTDLAVPAPIGPGVLVGDENSPPFQNIVATAAGDTINVTWQASPVVPDNFVTATASIVPYSGTVSS